MTQDSSEKGAEHERIHALVAKKAQAWDQAGRPDELLMRGEELIQVAEWRWYTAPADRTPKLNGLESQYITASLFEKDMGDLTLQLESYQKDERLDIRKPVADIRHHLKMIHELFENQPQRLPSIC